MSHAAAHANPQALPEIERTPDSTGSFSEAKMKKTADSNLILCQRMSAGNKGPSL